MNYLKWVPVTWWPAAALMLCALAAPGAAPGSGVRPEEVGSDPLWDDGKAEISIYGGTTPRYGTDRPTSARIVVVKEDLLRDALVKSDAGPIPGRTREVLKLVFVAEFPTGSYFYRQAATTFLARPGLEVLKENMSHFDNCGVTYVRVGPKNGRLTHEAHSYWEGEADREVPISWPGAMHTHWDALPLWLRQWAGEAAPPELKVWLLPGQIMGRSPIENTRPVQAIVRVTDGGMLEVPAGRFASRKIAVTTPAGTDLFWFDRRSPHVLLRLETAAGSRLALQKTVRLDYWNHKAPEDARLLQ